MSVAQQNSDLSALYEDVSVLKHDLAELIAHLRGDAKPGAASLLDGLDKTAQKLYRDAATNGASSMRAIGDQINENPVAALLIAAGLGYIGGRLLIR